MAEDVRVNFKTIFKRYKQKCSIDYQRVITFEEGENQFVSNGTIRSVCVQEVERGLFGIKSTKEWAVFELTSKAGLIIVKNPFTSIGQRYWITRCLRDFPKKPNKRNIDIENDLKDVSDLWNHCLSQDFSAFDKLRWVTLGYHHNWDTKVYSEDTKGAFPKDLALLSEYFANALGYSQFEAQAAIVNMYHKGSSLSGHVDKSEVDLQAPLFSFSFGQSAIFLIGGTSLDEPAQPLLLESGDVMVMSHSSRLCYHAVPRIILANSKPWNSHLSAISNSHEGFCDELIGSLQDDNFWEPFERYVTRSRINMNVRQVLPPGIHSLN